jgi:glycosyltransferase involved in cell wall biosynthesis
MKLLFFVENNWAFGKIHNDLIKALYPEIYCDILDWRVSYNLDCFKLFQDKYDYFLTTTHGANGLEFFYNVPPSKIIAIIHAKKEIEEEIFKVLNNKERVDYNVWLSSLASFTSVSEELVGECKKNSIIQDIPVLPIGCFTANYKKNTGNKIENILYCGPVNNNQTDGNKRPHLIEEVCKRTGTNFHAVHDLNFLCMEEVYHKYDLLMFASFSEGLPTVAIEAIASHVPVLGTNTGIMGDIAEASAGFICPFEENEYIDFCVNKINELNSDTDKYHRLKQRAELLSYKYDWNMIKPIWIDFFKSLGSKIC